MCTCINLFIMTLAKELTPQLAAIIKYSQRKGTVKARDVQHGILAFRNISAVEIRACFQQLEKLGYGYCSNRGSRLTFTAKEGDMPLPDKSNGKKYQQEIVVQPALALTKREYFAAVALQGLLANPNLDIKESNSYGYLALFQADNLLAELEEDPEG